MKRENQNDLVPLKVTNAEGSLRPLSDREERVHKEGKKNSTHLKVHNLRGFTLQCNDCTIVFYRES